MKKTLTMIFIGVLLGSTVVFATSKIFSDVPSNIWYSDAVTSLADKGIITGYPDGTFGPTKNVNRAELAVMLNRLIEYIETGSVSSTSSSCIEEGESFFASTDEVTVCCNGLEKRDAYEQYYLPECIINKGGRSVCIKSDDGICGSGENNCNSPEDCK